MLGTYDDRTGAAYCPPEKIGADGRCDQKIWVRLIGETGRYDNQGTYEDRGPSYHYGLTAIESGIDLLRDNADKLGIYAGMGNVHGALQDLTTASGEKSTGSADFNGVTLGGYWTHHGDGGWYADAVLQSTWYDRIDASVAGGAKTRTAGYDVIASIEAGVPFDLGGHSTLEPEVQLVYQHLHMNDGKDAYGLYHYPNADTLYGRIGAKLARTWGEGADTTTAWLRANFWHADGLPKTVVSALDGSAPTSFSGSPTLGSTWAQLGVGLSGQATKAVNLFGTLDYNHTLSSGKGHSVVGRVGVRISW
jgi:outer membrane autotransporter protein